MNKKRISAVGLIVMLLVAAMMGEFTDLGSAETTTSAAPHGHEPQTSVHYTRHARCRMGCRQISEKEIFEVFKSGQKNIKKSNPNASPCPVTAMEGATSDNQTVRVVYGQCGNVRKIITVIDLKNDFPCDCD